MKIFSKINLQKAYRKHKSMIYYDTFGAIDREKLADFEIKNNLQSCDNYFQTLYEELQDDHKRKKRFDQILSQVKVRCYPKKIKKTSDASVISEKENSVITSSLPQSNKVESIQYQIDLPIEAHILGVLWVMEFGIILDKKLINNCFANRLKSYINQESDEGISPFLFEPYFKKYEKWRDSALDVAQQHLDGGKDVLIISLDIKSYYYYANIDFKDIIETIQNELIDQQAIELSKECEILTRFIENLFKKYTKLFSFSEKKAVKPFIPIGFAPSMIIANWYLNDFDRNILQKLHPIYYGRYVDDFLIVLPYYSDREDFYKINDVIDTYFTNTRGYPQYNFFKKSKVNNSYNFVLKKYKNLSIQMSKFKVYIFKHDDSRAIINNFRREILHNSSEFRYMFEKDSITKHIDDEIYTIDYEDTINKIRSINGLDINKFGLSKVLSKLIYASVENGYRDRLEMFRSLIKIFTSGNGIDLFTLWEKLLTLLFLQERYEEIKILIHQLLNLIKSVDFLTTEACFTLKDKTDEIRLKNTLRNSLVGSLCRVMALRSSSEKNSELEKDVFSQFIEYNFVENDFINYRKKYLESNLVNSKLTITLINNLKYIKYFPRYVQLHECFLQNINNKISKNEIVRQIDYFSDSFNLYYKINYMHDAKEGKERRFFNAITCPCSKENNVGHFNHSNNEVCGKIRKGEVCSQFNDKLRINKISVGDNKYNFLRIGIASVQVHEKNIKDSWAGRSNKNIERMDELIVIINEAIKQNVNMLVMPECYVPYSWTGHIIEAARKHNMAMIFGIEHIVQNKIAYNYLMTVLPAIVDGYNNCIVKMRLKNFYSPAEIEGIQSYHLNLPLLEEGFDQGMHQREFDLFSWNGVNFAPYNCFELTHINDRALFKSEIDLLIACEDNKDTGYFANIIDSLALDLHCYCVQVNASQYGDSKIAQPKESFKKNILSIKGGNNPFLVVGEIDIKSLRDFQICGRGSFKPLPPGFNYRRVRDRMGLG